MTRPDMALYMMWEDSKKERYNVGLLVQTAEYYYLAVNRRETMSPELDSEYVEIPGMKPGEIYRSPRIFDFIQERIAKSELGNPCQALMDRNGGRSPVDSFYFEPVAKSLIETKVQQIQDLYNLQETLKDMDKPDFSDPE